MILTEMVNSIETTSYNILSTKDHTKSLSYALP